MVRIPLQTFWAWPFITGVTKYVETVVRFAYTMYRKNKHNHKLTKRRRTPDRKLYYGLIAFARDAGLSWRNPLLVDDQNLMILPCSIFLYADHRKIPT